jgi:TonB family protein
MIEHWTAGATDLARAATWWLIENAPSRMEAATATLMWLAPGPRSADEAERQRLRQAWSQQAQKHSANASVQANAAQIANSFQARFEAEELLIRARRLEPENESYLTRLATLYAFALPELNNNPNPSPESTAFQSKVLSELETTTDAQLAGLVGERLIVGPIVISAGQSAESEAPLRDRLRRRQQLAAKYLGRARTLDPNNEHWAALMRRAADEPMVIRFPDPAPGVRRITVGGGVQQAKTKKTVDPEYPLQALAAGIQGVVRFYVVIGTDGTIQHLIPTEGHSLLLPAAIDAVKQWIYQPTLLNGVPVEVVTQVDVFFNSPRSPAAAEAASALRIGGGVSAPVPISRAEPVFPKGIDPEVTNARVLLLIIVGTDGSVTKVEPLRGDPAFFENAIQAVKQWKFKPGMKQGEPVPVRANVEVSFRKM